MTRDGRHRTDLTPGGELRDNFHAYWSPDGRYVSWTSLDWNSSDGGDGRSEVRVARFDPSGPRLTDVHTVRPGNGHWYETQWWAPDGSGFLYTETVDTAINPELFFCRLPDPAGGACRPQRLTRNPAWDEQAIFTPDMKSIVFMSSRGHPGAFTDWSQLANILRLPAYDDYLLILPVFAESYLQPVFQQATDLYALRLRWNESHTRFRVSRAVRRLTRSGDRGWVIPEFAWDPSGKRLLWTESQLAGRVDELCVLRQIRGEILRRLADVHTIDQLPLDIVSQIRGQIAQVIGDPQAFAEICGGNPRAPRLTARRTRIGRFVG
ncbi:hypothetical protein AYO39_02415 [Actinobacteria bacterium SCGC AG-212-D09]|nr:hypothetical protein AYO39_02415 [Actinobacteria bacterium SCGC AG-212-D09]